MQKEYGYLEIYYLPCFVYTLVQIATIPEVKNCIAPTLGKFLLSNIWTSLAGIGQCLSADTPSLLINADCGLAGGCGAWNPTGHIRRLRRRTCRRTCRRTLTWKQGRLTCRLIGRNRTWHLAWYCSRIQTRVGGRVRTWLHTRDWRRHQTGIFARIWAWYVSWTFRWRGGRFFWRNAAFWWYMARHQCLM